MSDKPGPIDPTNVTTIATDDGALYAETFAPKGDAKGVVLITHGYAEHCGRYREVAHVIVNAGWAVMTYDVRGHGQSPGARGFVDRFDTYLRDFHAAVAAAKQLAPGKPLVLLGHSHGSLITLRALASDRATGAVAAIVSSPYLGIKAPIPGYKKVLARVASKIAPGLGQPNQITADQLTSDPQKQAEHDNDKLNFGTATARWFTESSAAQDFVLANASRINLPTTWLVGGADPLCDPAASKRVADRVKDAKYIDLAGLKHEVFNEVERGKVFSHLTSALAACSAASA